MEESEDNMTNEKANGLFLNIRIHIETSVSHRKNTSHTKITVSLRLKCG